MVNIDISATEWAALRGQADRPRLIDVREPWEFNLARLPEAELLPMGDVYGWSGTLNKAAAFVFVCHHGSRSASICQFLRSLGFQDARNFTGGMDAWSRMVDPSVPRY